MKHQGYITRALRARDPRYARLLGKLGYDVAAVAAAQSDDAHDQNGDDALKALRGQYAAAFGKKPFHGWSADELRERLGQREGGVA